MKKKICYVVTMPGTVEAFFIPQLKYLSQNGFDVTVICSPSEDLQRELGDTVRFAAVDIPRGSSIGGTLKAIGSLTNHFKKERYDLVQYSTPNAALCASIASKLAGIRVRNYHLMGFRYLGEQGLVRQYLKLLERLTCRLSTSIECVSRSNLELGVREDIFDRKKAVVVWNGSTGGVDLNRFDHCKREQWRRDIRSELGYTDQDFIYGFVGRITRDKGINELLEAFLSLKDDSKLILIGNIEAKEKLDRRLLDRARKSKKVQHHRPVEDIERYYAALDVLVLPSYREGFGNVVIEAAAVGTPAIVSNIPGPIDAIQEDATALAVPSKDPVQLAEKMRKIRACDHVKMGDAAVRFTESSFDSRVLCERILKRKRRLLESIKD